MKIVWLDLNSSYAHSSLALPALHAQVADRDDYEWDIVSATINENAGNVAGEVYRRQPDIVAATNWLFTHEALLHIVSRVKAMLPSCVVVMGGPEFLGDNEHFLRSNQYINAVFRGEGEESFPKWLELWDKPEEWNGICGLCYIGENGEYIDNGTARVMNFASLVPPENSRFFNWSKPFVQLETTRGCFNTCAFCVSGGEKPVRTLSIEQIRERLDLIHKHGIANIRMLDRTFNYDNQRAKEILNLFKKYAGEIRFHLEIHPALLSDELKELLASMPIGLLHLEAGIQSLRKNVLDACNRHGKLDKALDGLRYLCSLTNMETHADLIAGLPFYNLEQLEDDIHTLAAFGAGEIQLESLKLLPGTEMRRRADSLGIIYSPYPPYEVLMTKDISIEELQTARLLSRVLDDFYNTKAWQSVTRTLMTSHSEFLRQFLNFLIKLGVADQPMSLERRGILLYEFCKTNYPQHLTEVSIAWIEAGMSLKKSPAELIKTKHQSAPESWTIVYGEYNTNLRLCFLPERDSKSGGHWFGFETEVQNIYPVFRAFS